MGPPLMLLAGALACAGAVWLAAVAVLAPAPPYRRLAHPEAASLRDAGWRWPLVLWEGSRLAAAATLGAAAWLAGWDPGAPITVGLVAPSVALQLRSASRREQRRRAALAQLRVVGAALASGAGLVEAIRRAVASERDAVAARPLERALQAFSVGASLSEGLREGVDSAHPRTRSALLTLAIGVEERLPATRFATLVDSTIERLAFEEQVDTEVRARASGARLQIWAMAAIVPVLGLYLVATVPLVAEVLGSDLGRRLLVPAAVALELSGILLARRAVREVTA